MATGVDNIFDNTLKRLYENNQEKGVRNQWYLITLPPKQAPFVSGFTCFK